MRRPPPRLRTALLLALAASALCGCGGARFPPPAARVAGVAPGHGALFGAWANPDVTGGTWWSRGEIAKVERQLGRKLDIDAHVARFAADGSPAPGMRDELMFDASSGRTPLLTWNGPSKPFPGLEAVAAGSTDAAIRAWGRLLASVGEPILLRPWWEMNGDWYPWSGSAAGGAQAPPVYVRAWRRLRSVLRRAGATNVQLVWCPNAKDVPAAPWNHWSAYYPGDDAVDWVGVDGYNWGHSDHPGERGWRSFATVFGGGGVYADYAARKPIMVAEFGSVEQGGAKGLWYRQAASEIRERFPAIRAVVLWDSYVGSADFRINTSPAARAGIRQLARDRYFNPRRQELR
jgi:hypothetical protein